MIDLRDFEAKFSQSFMTLKYYDIIRERAVYKTSKKHYTRLNKKIIYTNICNNLESINNFNYQIKQNIDAKDFRRNIIVSGISLNELINKKIKINDVTLKIHEICQPCKYLQDKLKISGLIKMLVNKSGVRAEILSSGSLSVGDVIKIMK